MKMNAEMGNIYRNGNECRASVMKMKMNAFLMEIRAGIKMHKTKWLNENTYKIYAFQNNQKEVNDKYLSRK